MNKWRLFYSNLLNLLISDEISSKIKKKFLIKLFLFSIPSLSVESIINRIQLTFSSWDVWSKGTELSYVKIVKSSHESKYQNQNSDCIVWSRNEFRNKKKSELFCCLHKSSLFDMVDVYHTDDKWNDYHIW